MWHQRLKTTLSWLALGLVSAVTLSANAGDDGFSGGVTPSRFELRSEGGQLLRNSLKIYNLGARPQQFTIKTVDWSFSEAGEISFQEPLAADSCREWVRLERHRINVVPDPQRPRNFRFEIQVPDEAPAQECRFAIMIESLEGDYAASFASGSVNMPISGRIAVIVYLGVGEVEPKVEIGSLAVRRSNPKGFPSVEVRNLGSAHGRLDADLIAVDATGTRTRMSIATSPILPGQTRHLLLTPVTREALQYPLTVSGKIFTDKGAARIEQTLQSDGRGLLATK